MDKININININYMLQVWNNNHIIIIKKMFYVPEFHPQNGESE